MAIPCYMEQLKITCVINAAPELPDTPLPDSKPLYFQVPVLDKGDIDINAYFDEAADLIEQVRQANGATLVHCVAGVSRSASLCIAYLMKHMRMTLNNAYAMVKAARYALIYNSLTDIGSLISFFPWKEYNQIRCDVEYFWKLTNHYKHCILFNCRPQIRPNIGFFRQLISYEQTLLGKTSVAMVFKESLGQEIPDVYEPEYKAMEDFYQKHRHRHLKLR